MAKYSKRNFLKNSKSKKKNYIKRRRSSINRAKYSIIGGMQSNHNVYDELIRSRVEAIDGINIPDNGKDRALLWKLMEKGEVVEGTNTRRAFAVKDLMTEGGETNLRMFLTEYGSLAPVFPDLKTRLTYIVAQLDKEELKSWFGV